MQFKPRFDWICWWDTWDRSIGEKVYANYSFWNLYDQIWNLDSEQIDDIYKDRIFCTDQDVDQLNKNDHYELNKGQYLTYDGYDNTYLVI